MGSSLTSDQQNFQNCLLPQILGLPKLPLTTDFSRASELPKLPYATNFVFNLPYCQILAFKERSTARKLVMYKYLHLWIVKNLW